MATRRAVREAFYSELEQSASPHLDPSDIRQDSPPSEELPAIVHRDSYRGVPMNRGAAPVKADRDANGNVTAEYYANIEQAQFSLLIVSENEQTKEDIYEAVKSHFEAFTTLARDASDIHPDAHRVEVSDTNSEDYRERDPVARGDRLTISLNFTRLSKRDVDPMEDVEHNIGDMDGTTHETYTTT